MLLMKLSHVGSTDNGTWRRLTAVPFNEKFSRGQIARPVLTYRGERIVFYQE